MEAINYYISLDSQGNLYQIEDNKLFEYQHNDNTSFTKILKSFQHNPYQTFFETPFHAISYVMDDKIIETFKAHPSSFYPGSPFDIFEVIKTYFKDNRIIIPRFYLYPSSHCNSHCPICQFNFRRESASFLHWEVIKNILEYMSSQEIRPQLLSIIISGDGEPTLHPDFIKILDYCMKLKIHVFLTSNWILPDKKRDVIIDTVANCVDMLTISLKGLNSTAYHQYQGIESSMKVFDRVIENIETLLEKLEKTGRRKDTFIGIASLILPENTPSYNKMINYVITQKINYIYFNVVEPTYDHWKIYFTETEKRMTMEVLEHLKTYKHCGTIIRYPKNPFKMRYNNSI